MKVISDQKHPIKMWLNAIEVGAVQQARNVAELPFLYKWVAIMPDAHQGYGMPIGGVAALDGYISPNMVGVDIGCGMCAVKTSLEEIELDELKKILGLIRAAVPVGFEHHKEKQPEQYMPWSDSAKRQANGGPIVEQQYESALGQVGTLGGGNHFIEIQKGSDGFIWLMVHSGSRNIGFKVANYYNKEAIKINDIYFSSVPKKWELAFFPIDSKEGRAYRVEMDYCTAFALANRSLMMDRIREAVGAVVPCIFEPQINIAHNYAAMENHYGRNVMVHRKGATRAREGDIGIIPGSQGTNSYIVKGLGNQESFQSCSHGAGRTMGRKQATRELSLEKEIARLERQGILHSIRSEKDLDEAPGAYKDIHMVMENQKDLVEIMVELRPLAVIKG